MDLAITAVCQVAVNADDTAIFGSNQKQLGILPATGY
jgi:hypothetical protein